MSSCYECGGYVDGYETTCPDCVRLKKAERRAREREEDNRLQRESEFRQQQRQREWELEEQNRQYEVNRLLSAAAIHGDSWGYSIDRDVADYDFMLSEDGQLSWNCRPKAIFAADLVANKLIRNGFFRRMNESIGKNPPGVVTHISQCAYNAGAEGLISDFYIPYEHKGFTFRLDLSPRVQFDLDENNTLVWKRVEIFKNKELMLQYDKGLSQYANSQEALLTSRIIEVRKQEEAQKDIERREARKHELLGNTLIFYMFFSCLLLPWYLTGVFFHPYYWGTSVVLTAFLFRGAASKESPKASVFTKYTLWNFVTYLWFL